MDPDTTTSGLLGYSWLLTHLNILDHLPLSQGSLLAGTSPPPGFPYDTTWHRWHKNYALADDPRQHVAFALRHEPLRQDLLKAVFRATGPEMWRQEVLAHPRSRQAALAGFYYERLTGETMDCPGSSCDPLEAMSPTSYFTAAPVRNKRWHILDNLPGSPGFCPLVRRTEALERQSPHLRALLSSALAGAHDDAPLLERAGLYLAIKDTQASFAIEHETPSPDRMRRFVQAVNAYSQSPLTPEHLFAVQNAVIDNPLLKSPQGVYRHETVYVGESRHGSYGIGFEKIHFIAPDPRHVEGMMRDWFTAIERPATDPLAFAAAAAFGLVFIHPFPDGNGRTHRFVLQHLLAHGGLCPDGVALPLSAWLQRNARAYDAALEAFSRPLMGALRFHMDTEGVVTIQNDLSDAYRYFDATVPAETVGQAVQSVLTEDIPHEIQFLRTFDAARLRLKEAIDLPDKEMDVAIHTILREGRMSKSKRDRYFAHYPDEVIRRMEHAVLSGPADADMTEPTPSPRGY